MSTNDKMSLQPMRTRFAHAVLAGALTATLAAGGIAPVAAYAEEPTGSVTVTAIEGNESNTYKVYQLFTANVDANDNATHVKWNEEAKDVVLAFLERNGYSGWLSERGYTEGGASEKAKYAAEFISYRIQEANNNALAGGEQSISGANSFAAKFARALAKSSLVPDSATVGEAYSNVEGYYLIITNSEALSVNGSGTAPIWISLGDQAKTITEKSAVPQVDKKVKGIGDSEWTNATDAFHGQDVDFRLTGSMPSNIKTFSTYHCKFVDNLSGVKLKGDNRLSVKVFVGQKNITSLLTGELGTITYANDTLTVDIVDLLAIEGVEVDKDTQVVVEYKAHVTSADGTAVDGGSNSVSLTYTADPVSDAEATTDNKTVKVYSYKTNAVKIDQDSGQALEGAKFSVQVASYAGDPALVGKYVQADGSLGAAAYEFVSGTDGTFTIPGLDAGTYTIKETSAPAGYAEQSADITLVVASEIDPALGTITDFDATATGGEAPTANGAGMQVVESANAVAGEVELQIVDPKQFQLANTGLEGLSAYLAIALALAGAGAIVLVASRKREHEVARG